MSNLFTVSIGDFWITIQCLQNPTIDRWYESAKLIYRDTANLKTLQNPIINGMKSSCVVKPYYDKILRTLDELRTMGLALPEEPGEFNFDQQWCNRVHRYFTTLCITKGKMDFKSSFVLKENDQLRCKSIVSIINDNVHKLENYFETSHRRQFLGALRSMLIAPNKVHIHEFNKEDYQNHMWEHHDVVFEDDIVGKSIITSFFDEDDPKNLDTFGHRFWKGSFRILLDSRTPIYESKEFNSWLESHATTKSNLRANFPIGDIIDLSHDLNTIWLARAKYGPCAIKFHN
jgi:hypothetical protein